jgi:hypothetical protein
VKRPVGLSGAEELEESEVFGEHCDGEREHADAGVGQDGNQREDGAGNAIGYMADQMIGQSVELDEHGGLAIDEDGEPEHQP